MTKERQRAILFAIVTLAPFITFAVLNFAPWWVSAPFTILAFLWWFGSLLLLKEHNDNA